MKKKTAFLLKLITPILLLQSTYAATDTNLIPLKSSQTDGYDTFHAFVLKNSIKNNENGEKKFSVLLTGVSTIDPLNNEDLTPISQEERIEEYDLENGRVILSVNMNCKSKQTIVEKILSIDPQTSKLKEQKNLENEQDTDMNNALYDIVCK